MSRNHGLLAAAICLLSPGLARAADSPPGTGAVEQGIMFRLGQCEVQSIALPEQVKTLQAEVMVQRRRADEAEAKLAAAAKLDAPKGP